MIKADEQPPKKHDFLFDSYWHRRSNFCGI